MSDTSEEDPDITKSWVFIKKKSIINQKIVNGVEEIKKSDLDSDSDSISVISDSGCSYSDRSDDEIPYSAGQQKISTEPVPAAVEERITNDEVQEIVEAPSNTEEPQQETNFLALVTSAIVIVVVSLAFQLYFPSNAVEDFNDELEQENDYTSYCIQSFTKDDYIESYDVQQCINKFEEKSNERKRKYQIKIDGSNEANQVNKIEKSDDQKHINYVVEELATSAVLEELEIEGNSYQNKKIDELKAREELLRQKEEFLMKKEHDLIKKEIKINSQQVFCDRKKQKAEKERLHKLKNNQNRNLVKNQIRKSEENLKNEKNFKQGKEGKRKHHKNENKVNRKTWQPKSEQKKGETYEKHFKNKNFNKPKEERKKFSIITDEHNRRKLNVTGHWYSNLHKARNDIRKKEQVSDWLFERAHFRSSKRNKAHWYFQWMLDRERLRVK